MPLLELPVPLRYSALPSEAARLIELARVEQDRFELQRKRQPIPGFVPSDYVRVYHVLAGIVEQRLLRGTALCEWGSGFGVVACLGAMLGLRAFGLEVESELVARARQLAADFHLPVEYSCGSFIPQANRLRPDLGDSICWLDTEAPDGYEPLEMTIEDFDLIYVYPWPGEDLFVEQLFQRYGGEGALLLSYHGTEQFRLRRKTRGTSRR